MISTALALNQPRLAGHGAAAVTPSGTQRLDTVQYSGLQAQPPNAAPPAPPAQPQRHADGREIKSVGEALKSAAWWGFVGGVAGSIPVLGAVSNMMSGALVGDLINGKEGNHRVKWVVGTGLAGLATHTMDIRGVGINPFGHSLAYVSAGFLFGALSWGIQAYSYARGHH